jgi:hypothetical protein
MAENSIELGGHAGRPKSWLVVAVMIAGFLISGIALPLGPVWPMFWGGAVVVVLGGLLGAAVGITDDTVEDGPRILPPELAGRDGAGDVVRDSRQLSQ